MKSILNKTKLLGLGLLVTSFSLLSFTRFGGDTFEIYLNGKLLHQQALYNKQGVKTIALSSANYNDEMSVKFSHCGTVGKDRTITLKNGQDQTVKQWRFEDSKGGLTPMTFKVKEILDLQKGSTNI